jgi:hypothetical protein
MMCFIVFNGERDPDGMEGVGGLFLGRTEGLDRFICARWGYSHPILVPLQEQL